MPSGTYKRKEYHRKRMSEGAKSRKITLLFRKARSDNAKINPNYGMKGKHHSEKVKKKMSKTRKGMIPWNKGTKGMMRVNSGSFKEGEKSRAWKGGISFEPYSIDWTKTLRRAIRERDNYICQLCSQYGNVVHHKDYDKKNCNPNNLITLCRKCNAKVNFNRNYWTNYFRNLNK